MKRNASLLATFWAILPMFALLSLPIEAEAKESYTNTFEWFKFEGDEKYDLMGSKHFLPNLTKTGFYDTRPRALKEIKQIDSKRAFGMNVSWSRKGHNYVDIVPAEGHPLKNKPFPGRIESIDFWVWGANYNYEIYITLENENKYAYDLKVGNLNFLGWKKLKINIPQGIAVHKRQLAKEKGGLKFKRFRVYTTVLERVDQFSFFIDSMRVTTDLFEGNFDGLELQRLFFEEEDKKDEAKTTGSSDSAPQRQQQQQNNNQNSQ